MDSCPGLDRVLLARARAVVFASIMLWYLADAFGALQSIEKSARSLFSLKSSRCTKPTRGRRPCDTSLGGVVLASHWHAVFYNLMADVIGGVQIIVSRRPRTPNCGGFRAQQGEMAPSFAARAVRGLGFGPSAKR